MGSGRNEMDVVTWVRVGGGALLQLTEAETEALRSSETGEAAAPAAAEGLTGKGPSSQHGDWPREPVAADQ